MPTTAGTGPGRAARESTEKTLRHFIEFEKVRNLCYACHFKIIYLLGRPLTSYLYLLSVDDDDVGSSASTDPRFCFV